MLYLETSAAVKLVVEEPQSVALRRLWLGDIGFFSSDLVRIEVLRATRRVDPDRLDIAEALLSDIHLLEVTRSIVRRASSIGPALLRSLDAVHLASAMELAGDLEGIVTYDDRLAAVASGLGLTVFAPA